jgi:tRNA A37 threonylcarbamoyladenosine dehydratase
MRGEETQESLQNKRIAIIGCGGLGSTPALILGSSGIGYIELVDFDTLSTHSLHRQIAYIQNY